MSLGLELTVVVIVFLKNSMVELELISSSEDPSLVAIRHDIPHPESQMTNRGENA